MMAEIIRVFGRIGLLSFGGPAAQIALIHKELVQDRDWLSEAQFLRALSFCMLLPGPEAMQLATYAGWKRAGIKGGLIAGGLFVLPGACVIAALAFAYVHFGELAAVQALFSGVQAAVVAIVVAALIKLATRALQGPAHVALALAAFVALFVFALPFPAVILAAGLIGALTLQGGQAEQPVMDQAGTWRQSFWVMAIGAALWIAPLIWLWLIGAAFLRDVALFFSTLAVVTFGGAYAVLAYMTQEVVQGFGWLSTAQMMDALGLAETTPGPLILVTQFVAMIAGAAEGGFGLALAAGGLTLWVTFVPCFIWIFAGAPLIDRLERLPRLRGALAAITAAVVGVMGNLTVWFALHVIFAAHQSVSFGPATILLPDLTTLQPFSIALAGLAAGLLIWRGWSLVWVLLLCAGLALASGML